MSSIRGRSGSFRSWTGRWRGASSFSSGEGGSAGRSALPGDTTTRSGAGPLLAVSGGRLPDRLPHSGRTSYDPGPSHRAPARGVPRSLMLILYGCSGPTCGQGALAWLLPLCSSLRRSHARTRPPWSGRPGQGIPARMLTRSRWTDGWSRSGDVQSVVVLLTVAYPDPRPCSRAPGGKGSWRSGPAGGPGNHPVGRGILDKRTPRWRIMPPQ